MLEDRLTFSGYWEKFTNFFNFCNTYSNINFDILRSYITVTMTKITNATSMYIVAAATMILMDHYVCLLSTLFTHHQIELMHENSSGVYERIHEIGNISVTQIQRQCIEQLIVKGKHLFATLPTGR